MRNFMEAFLCVGRKKLSMSTHIPKRQNFLSILSTGDQVFRGGRLGISPPWLVLMFHAV